MIPVKAKSMMDRLIQVSQDAVFKLESEPSTTIDYVNLLTFLDEIHEQVLHVTAKSFIIIIFSHSLCFYSKG